MVSSSSGGLNSLGSMSCGHSYGETEAEAEGEAEETSEQKNPNWKVDQKLMLGKNFREQLQGTTVKNNLFSSIRSDITD